MSTRQLLSTALRCFIGSSVACVLLVLAPACGEPEDEMIVDESAQAIFDCHHGFRPPQGTVAVTFRVDDRANRVYAAGDLKWKGSMLYDPETRVITFDPSWSGAAPGAPARSGWATLYDDGPWVFGGHEPIFSLAGDHVWGIAAFVAPPAEGSLTFEYGLIDESYEARLGNGWIWQGANGLFTVDAGARAPIVAQGMTFPRFGRTDLQLVLDTTQLNPVLEWDTSMATVKSSAWGWGELPLRDAGNQKLALELSRFVGPDNVLPHTGLLRACDQPEFVFVLDALGLRLEYRDYQLIDGVYYFGPASTMGVSAGTKPRGAHAYEPVPVGVLETWNTFVTIPGRAPHSTCD